LAYSNINAGDVDALFAAAWDWVNDLPSPEEKLRADAVKAVANAIEACNRADMPLDFINPLTEMMTRLSENAITKVPA